MCVRATEASAQTSVNEQCAQQTGTPDERKRTEEFHGVDSVGVAAVESSVDRRRVDHQHINAFRYTNKGTSKASLV